MPQIRYHRLWCQSCKDWELFKTENNSKCCKKCENPHFKTLLSDIPEDKIEEQRERYRVKSNATNAKFMSTLLSGGRDMFAHDGNYVEVIESDAGLEAKREREREERNRIREKNIAEIDKYQKAERNKPCPCNSGKKFKQCCSSRIQTLRLQYNRR